MNMHHLYKQKATCGKTYMKKTPEIDKTKRFGSVKKGWKLSEKDKEKVKKIRSAPR